MSKNKAILAPVAALAILFAAQTPCHAEIVKLTADLTGNAETPPSASKGSGTLKGLYDTTTKKLSWTIAYSGLTGPVTRADFHGPAGVGDYGSVMVEALFFDCSGFWVVLFGLITIECMEVRVRVFALLLWCWSFSQTMDVRICTLGAGHAPSHVSHPRRHSLQGAHACFVRRFTCTRNFPNLHIPHSFSRS